MLKNVRFQKTILLAVFVLAFILLAAASWLWLNRPAAPEPANGIQDRVSQPYPGNDKTQSVDQPSSDLATVQTPTEPEQPVGHTPKQYDGAAFAPSLADTDIDGQLAVDAEGKLIVSIEVKDFFDYFLNTVGEVSPEEALAEIERLARTHLPPAAAEEAMVLLDQYLAYKQSALELMQRPLLPPEQQTPAYHLSVLTDSLEQLKQIRRQTMSAQTVDAFFAMEEAYADFTLSRMAIQQDDNLTLAQKQDRVAQARQQLPEELRSVDEELERSAIRAQQASELLNTADSASQLRNGLQELQFTQEQISELVADWQQQQQFELRYAQYTERREQIMEAGLAGADQETQIQLLRQQFFPEEADLVQARLKDLEL